MGIEDDLKTLANPKNVAFKDLMKLAEEYFGEPRNSGSSHFIFKTPWPGDPRINLQRDGRMAKPYQVRQFVKALVKLKEMSHEKPR